MRVMIDLNVLLDVLQNRQPHFADSAAVVSAALRGDYEAWMPAHCLTTLHYLIERHDSLAAADAAVDWHLKHLKVGPLDAAVFLDARRLGMSDFEDAVVVTTAEAAGCRWIVTRNVPDFASSPVPAISPAAFLRQLSLAGSP
jgi:predicted nucleic acid-binding protein